MGDKAPLRWFQFTTRRTMVATLWAAVFSVGMLFMRLLWFHQLVAHEHEGAAYLLIGGLLFISIPAAIGGLFGRATWGAIVGVVVFLLYIGWLAFALNTWYGI